MEQERKLAFGFLMVASQSGGSKPRKERKENADMRRRQILDATLKSIVANGLAKTTLATVANEAGLSQGVAVFYFKSKTGILTEALRDQYQTYEAHWQAALDKADAAPAPRLRTIIEADFSPKICNPSALAIWFAFFGEQNFVPQYAEITGEFEDKRSKILSEICRQLAPDDPEKARLTGGWIDTLTDGYWQKLHLFPHIYTREAALEQTLTFLQTLFPNYTEAFQAKTGN
ncbi:TetR family transcriptional regulator C-terminal domain-containing protein [Leisingera sp. M658]|uniref:TetR family transcriptional regulator C-terminal domain-containing protein n=1 Tax=Leisingera sp. M658 TaxID=2867015 RepID=UPI0021A7ED9F|nr:TetR family transcriptional regulator C-terminal domain-containing protein [Leisingera sp. M658]UWQ74310.1 TetR family transcriptional regulator C-terminal domain-containing protein [Leisingera sp. M658]